MMEKGNTSRMIFTLSSLPILQPHMVGGGGQVFRPLRAICWRGRPMFRCSVR